MGETSKGKAKRMKNCTPSKIQSCIQTQPIMNPILKDAAPVTTSLYCFSTYMAETGQTKRTVDELGNLQLQYKRDIGIFQCDFWQVFTEGDAELAPGVPFVKVFDTDGDFHFAKRKETGGWINTGLHAAAWKAVKEEGKYKSAEWVMKLDAASSARWARTSSRSSAWTQWASRAWSSTISAPTASARPTARWARRRTRSTCRTARRCPRHRFTR